MTETPLTGNGADPKAGWPSPPPSRFRIYIARPSAAVYTGLILAVTMWPTPVTEGPNEILVEKVLDVTHSAGVSEAFEFHALQFVAIIAMFVPFGFLLTLTMPRQIRWLALLGPLLLSSAVELVQELLLPQRSGDVWDVVANTAGGTVGVGLAIVLWEVVDARDIRVVARALHRAHQA